MAFSFTFYKYSWLQVELKNIKKWMLTWWRPVVKYIYVGKFMFSI